jgi:LPXTG-motif cell wall-anchored protein
MMFRFYRKKSIALLLTVCFLLTMVAPGFAAGTGGTGNSLQDARDGIVGYYSKNKTNLDTWREVIGLKEAGQDVSRAPWVLPDWKTDQLNEDSQPTDYAGTILGMLAAGQNPKDVGGRNLVDELAALQNDDGSFSTWMNQTIWAVIALDKAGGSYDTEKAVEFMLSQQKSDGGFALFGDSGDPDTTGDALVVLAQHKDIAGVSDSINSAIGCLKALQLPNGGFSSWGNESPESAAAVIRGLLACGEKNITSGDWQKEKGNMIDSLFSFQLEDGSFIHSTSETKYNAMATEQALMAVADMVNAGITYTVKTGQRHTGDEIAEATVRVRVEGLTKSLADKTVTVTGGTAFDALKAAVGEQNVVAPGGFVTSILGESGKQISDDISTSWMYYCIRNGEIEPGAFSQGAGSFNVQDGDQVIFYIGAMDSTWAPTTFVRVLIINAQTPFAGKYITLTIKTIKNDWMAGLIELTAKELEAIGEYTVMVGDKKYVTQNGKVTIKADQAGTLSFIITNQNEAGYPNVVPYKGEINVLAADEGGTTGGTDKQDNTKGKTGLPKTGGNNLPMYLVGIALLFAGALTVRRKQHSHVGRK